MIATSVKSTATADDVFFANILAAIDGNPAIQTKPELPKLTLQQNLNRLINRGISFAVKADNFEIAAGAEKLTKTDTDYLTVNAKGILCHLQQILLCKEIFDQEPTLLDDFKTEVADKESILTDGAENVSVEIHETVVIETTKSWFAHAYGGNQ